MAASIQLFTAIRSDVYLFFGLLKDIHSFRLFMATGVLIQVAHYGQALLILYLLAFVLVLPSLN